MNVEEALFIYYLFEHRLESMLSKFHSNEQIYMIIWDEWAFISVGFLTFCDPVRTIFINFLELLSVF